MSKIMIQCSNPHQIEWMTNIPMAFSTTYLSTSNQDSNVFLKVQV